MAIYINPHLKIIMLIHEIKSLWTTALDDVICHSISFFLYWNTYHISFSLFFLFLNENPHEERPPWIAFLEPDAMPGIKQEHDKILLNDIALCNKNFPEINMYIMILEVLRLYSACKCHKIKTFKSYFFWDKNSHRLCILLKLY